MEKKRKEKEPDLNLQPVHCQYFSLDREYRDILVLRLKAGGKDEAIKVYNQIRKEFHQTWHLKVCKLSKCTQ